MIYFIVTTSLKDLPSYLDKQFLSQENFEIRKEQYINGISKLIESTKEMGILDYKIVIVENNGKRETFLDNLGCDVLYTNNNNLINNCNIGIKEMRDILDCIDFFEIQNDDLVIKITGRYILQKDSLFMNIIKFEDKKNIKAIFKNTNNYIFTGLIGLQCSYVKQINYDCHFFQRNSIEYQWEEVISRIDPSNKIEIKDIMGIMACPGCNTYHLF